MNTKYLTRVMMAALAVTALAWGSVALASSGTGHPPVAPVRSAAVAAPVTAAIAAFRATPDASDIAGQQKLSNAFASAAADNVATGLADFQMATPAPVDGAGSQVWIAPSGDGVCTYIPDPVDGWGGTCAPLSTVEAGEAFSFLGGPNGHLGDKVIVAVVVPDGGASPVAVSADGQTQTLSVTSNVAAAVLPTSDTLEVGHQSIHLSVVDGPAKVRYSG